MKRAVLATLAAMLVLAMAATPSLAGPFATIGVTFSDDYHSATMTSSKGVSHYDIVLCDGTSFRTELSGNEDEVTAGPYDAQIVSVTVKSGRTELSFLSGFSGECKKTPPPPDPK
jgi:Tfp pilus assembly protein PilV